MSTVLLDFVNCDFSAALLAFTPSRNVNTSAHLNGLMEFFDDKKNWGENEVKTGRSWKKDELRIKSNTDLHKLWY